MTMQKPKCCKMEDAINSTKGERNLEVKELAELLNEATTAPSESQ